MVVMFVGGRRYFLLYFYHRNTMGGGGVVLAGTLEAVNLLILYSGSNNLYTILPFSTKSYRDSSF